jgi:hypothetical protein
MHEIQGYMSLLVYKFIASLLFIIFWSNYHESDLIHFSIFQFLIKF